METKPPLPPYTPETAHQTVRLAEDAWNSRDPTAWCWSTPKTRAGATAPSFRWAARRFDPQGFMMRRFASINDLPIREADRQFFWPLGL